MPGFTPPTVVRSTCPSGVLRHLVTASTSETHQYEDGLQAGVIRYTVDAVTRCSTGVFTLAVWGPGLQRV